MYYRLEPIVRICTELRSDWGRDIVGIMNKEQLSAVSDTFKQYELNVIMIEGILTGIEYGVTDARLFYSDGTFIFNHFDQHAGGVQLWIQANQYRKSTMIRLNQGFEHIRQSIARLRVLPLPAGDAPPAGPTVAAARLDIRGAPFVQGNIMHF